MLRQTTIQNPIACFGIGLHSGRQINLTLKPAPQNNGITFVRSDVTTVDNIILANYLNIYETTLSTTVENIAKVKVSTIEHLMAAIWGCSIDNIIIEIDGPEVPIMDGSSKPFVFMLECAGLKYINVPRKFLKIKREVTVTTAEAECYVIPDNHFAITMAIDFPNKIIGQQKFSLSHVNCFREEIANARTFGFVKDIQYLQSKGLALGASLNNAIGIEEDNILNHDGLRYSDEFVRHKLLDAIGDFHTAGFLQGHFYCSKSGHQTNNLLLRKIFSDTNNYEYITK